MKNAAILLAAVLPTLAATGCAPARADLPASSASLTPTGGDDGDAWFRLHSPVLTDTDGDGIWAAGEPIELELQFTNQRGDHYYYPGVAATSDTEGVTVNGSENWWYGIDAGATYDATVVFTPDADLDEGTIVTFILSATSLSCDNGDPEQEAMYCPDPNPLSVPVRLGDRLPDAY